MPFKSRRSLLAALCLSALVPPLAHAQPQTAAWPAKPIHFIVPFAPGGQSDIVARTIAEKLAGRLGQPVVVENKAGAATTIGADYVAKSPADGYTILLAPAPFVITQYAYPKLPYDSRKDFTPVTLLVTNPMVVTVNASVPAKNFAEFVALMKAQPGKLNYGSPGNGSLPHVATEMFKQRAGLDAVHIPYKGGGGTRLFELKEVKDALAYLRVISTPTDTVNLRRILNVPRRGIGERAEACVAQLAERERIPFVAALGRAADAPGIATRSVAAIEAFTRMLEDLRTVFEGGSGVAGLLEAILEQNGYLRELRESPDPQDATRVENLAQLVAVPQEFAEARAEEGDGASSGGLEDFLERVSLVADADEIPDAPTGPDGEPLPDAGVVTLMTLHTAKGLEFPVVFLTGLELSLIHI